MVKHLPAMQETLVQSLGWEDPLLQKMATHSSILAWEIAWTEEPGGYNISFFLHSTGGCGKRVRTLSVEGCMGQAWR